MRRALSLAVALVAVSAVPAQAHDSLTAARLGAEVHIALRQAASSPRRWPSRAGSARAR